MKNLLLCFHCISNSKIWTLHHSNINIPRASAPSHMQPRQLGLKHTEEQAFQTYVLGPKFSKMSVFRGSTWDGLIFKGWVLTCSAFSEIPGPFKQPELWDSHKRRHRKIISHCWKAWATWTEQKEPLVKHKQGQISWRAAPWLQESRSIARIPLKGHHLISSAFLFLICTHIPFNFSLQLFISCRLFHLYLT